MIPAVAKSRDDDGIPVVADVLKGSLNAIVASRRILSGEAKNGVSDFLTNLWPTDGLSVVAVVPLPGHKFAVPAQDRVWRDDGYEFQQSLAADGVGAPFHSGTPTESAMAGGRKT